MARELGEPVFLISFTSRRRNRKSLDRYKRQTPLHCRISLSHNLEVANKHRSMEELRNIDATVERLREFIRSNYITVTEIAPRLGVRDGTIFSWIKGEFRPANPERITSFLDSMPAESSSGISPTRLRISRVQKLAWHSEATALPVLQTIERGDKKGQGRVPRGLP